MAHLAPFLMLLTGHAAHVLKKLVEVRQQSHEVSLAEFLALRPYKSALALLGSVAGYLLLAEHGVPSLVAAFGVGYAADSMLEVVGAKGRAEV